MTRKKELGQYFTNQRIANIMVDWVIEKSPSTILDPAVGTGIFLHTVNSKDPNIKKVGYEIDSAILTKFNKESNYKANIENKDYLLNFPNKTYDAIICNPPYNKFQNIKNRKNYINILQKNLGIKLSGYSNLYVYFLVKSIFELSPNGRCCYILPYEFLNTEYGKIIKKLLLDKQIVHSIVKINSSISLFDEALTTSCILFIENKINNGINFINIDDLSQLENFTLKNAIETYKTNFYSYKDLDSQIKWNIYFAKSNKNSFTDNFIPLKKICKVKRGIATGNNKFFILNKSKIATLKLSDDVCVPCITKSQDIKQIIFNINTFNRLVSLDKNMFLFDGTKCVSNNDFNYIYYGEDNNFHKSYLTSHRKPWYSVENKEPAPILISVFCRNKIKVVRNEMLIKNLTTFHGIYFNNDIGENEINILFCYLLTPIAQTILFKNKREYGNQLDKFEPNDLNNAHVINIFNLSSQTKEDILKIYNKLHLTDNTSPYISKLNDIFLDIINQ